MANTSKAIDAEIRRLEARKGLLAKRDSEVPGAIEVLSRYADVLSPVQLRRIAKIAGQGQDQAPAKKATKKSKTAGSVIPPKYQIPTGEKWSGRGHPPREFKAWSATADGKAWRKANPDQKFPLIAGAAAKKTTKKATKKAAKKA
ncbi:H-NS family nucleoid-associated regulatory protein [Luteimonas sp. SDU101]|uniref:H-NS family nucleoid-associated regulatory protein n=1 Tax=Luteimonas sp. SDU101 TaxID=3422593 RepID=UPI003EB7045B